ncbi:NADP-dependent malic enzyme [Candidatus Peregrinibacteria bacterium]|jgi:malate dehydrogenase (oxaloacetate-decarboxylating)|nr:NADP-dependent malic enzyme [Candidatus Peregrinibacteria bacterium]
MKNLKKAALSAHKKYKGKLNVVSKVPLKTVKDMSLFYTPGVAEPCKEIAKKKELAYEYTSKGHTIAVVTDGSAVLGLGNIGSLAGLPVMEGKAALFKEFGNVDAVPICLDTQDTEEIIEAVKLIAPSFGGINLEDISAPRCFEVEERLIKELDIPVFHDDQHGTAIVCLAGLINALKVVKKKKDKVRTVISGAGAAGMAIAKLLMKYGLKDIILVDSRGSIYDKRQGLNDIKKKMAKLTNRKKIKGGLKEVLDGADIFIGVSQPNVATKEMIASMNDGAIVFAMSNPDPEIRPKDAKAGGAAVIATGRSDYPNQINNVLVFPGIFKGALEARASKITDKMKIAAAEALAKLVKTPTANKVIPGVFHKGVAEAVAKAVKKFA